MVRVESVSPDFTRTATTLRSNHASGVREILFLLLLGRLIAPVVSLANTATTGLSAWRVSLEDTKSIISLTQTAPIVLLGATSPAKGRRSASIARKGSTNQEKACSSVCLAIQEDTRFRSTALCAFGVRRDDFNRESGNRDV